MNDTEYLMQKMTRAHRARGDLLVGLRVDEQLVAGVVDAGVLYTQAEQQVEPGPSACSTIR